MQLPPIHTEQDNHLLDNPDIMLTEIMRQEAESEIIQISMKIRNNEPLTRFCGKEVQVLNKEELSTGMMGWADIILVGTNNTRITINSKMRAMQGRKGEPEPGDKLICLRNYWDNVSSNGDTLINGTIGTIDKLCSKKMYFPSYINYPNYYNALSAKFVSETGENFGQFLMDKKLITNGEPSLNPNTLFSLSRNKKYKGIVPYEFTYAYAITYWKSQGSQWNNVLVLEESFPFDKETHQRALYTAITRAVKKCVIIKKN